VTVGEGTLLGVGVNVVPGVKIGKGVRVNAGMSVTRDVPDGERVSVRSEARLNADVR
jgi:acetyltransferase-like isoleucine patch superfamily enzyme